MEELLTTIIPPVVASVMEALGGQSLPDPDSVSYYALESDRKIYLDEDICERTMEAQRMLMRWNMEDVKAGKTRETAKPIWLYVMSYGGDLDYMWSLIDTIEASIAPVYTVNLGIAGSAASLIFVSGTKRFMMKNAKVVIHEGSAQLQGDAIKVQDAADSYKVELKRMKEFILTHTEIPKTQLMKKRANDWTLDSAYCLEHGVCDTVVEDMREII